MIFTNKENLLSLLKVHKELTGEDVIKTSFRTTDPVRIFDRSYNIPVSIEGETFYMPYIRAQHILFDEILDYKSNKSGEKLNVSSIALEVVDGEPKISITSSKNDIPVFFMPHGLNPKSHCQLIDMFAKVSQSVHDCSEEPVLSGSYEYDGYDAIIEFDDFNSDDDVWCKQNQTISLSNKAGKLYEFIDDNSLTQATNTSYTKMSVPDLANYYMSQLFNHDLSETGPTSGYFAWDLDPSTLKVDGIDHDFLGSNTHSKLRVS